MKVNNIYARFFAASDAAMSLMDAEGFLLSYNGQFEFLISTLDTWKDGIPAPEEKPVLKSIRDILGSKQIVLFWASVSRILNGECKEIVYEAELHPRNEKEGVTHWYNIHVWFIEKDESGPAEETGPFLGLMMEDKTLAVREEARLLEDKRVAERAMEAKSQFFANMSHEIRTPIQTITGVLELLEDTGLGREQTEYTRQINFSAEVLLSLINDILDYSKLEAGKMQLEHIDFDPVETIKQAAEMLALEARKKSLYIVTDISKSARGIIKGDPHKFRQILINLIKNAVKFTKTGGITITARPARLEKKEAIKVSVADTGIGVPPEARGRLFTTFMQADVSDTRRFGGTGLGLAISRNLVELMEGRIEMTPNEGGGSVFSFTVPAEKTKETPIPLDKPNITEPPPLPAAVEKLAKEKAFLRAGKKALVLIAEDHPVNRELLAMMLEKLSAGCVQASDGEEAVEKALSNPVDLVLMDIQMPRMNGYEAAKKLRERGFSRPIIAVTASAFPGEIEKCVKSGADAVITKPYKRADIERALEEWLWTGERPANKTPAPAPLPDKDKSSFNNADAVKSAPEEIFNPRELIYTFMGNEEMAVSLLRRFIGRTESQLNETRPLWAAEKWDDARREAHTIKGTALTMGGKKLGLAAARLEIAFVNRNIPDIEPAIVSLDKAFAEYKIEAEAFINAKSFNNR